MIEKILAWFDTCDLIQDDSLFTVDYIPPEAVSYALYKTGDANGGVIRADVGGGKLMGFSFVFATRFSYSEVLARNLANNGFFDALQTWIDDQNKLNNLPEVNGAQAVKVLQTGVLSWVDETQKTAEYQMICRLEYYKEA